MPRSEYRISARGDAAAIREVTAPLLQVPQHAEAIRGAIGHRGRHVGVHDVVDQRDVLVPDALDVVLAEPVQQHRGTLPGLHGHHQGSQALLQVVARGNGPSRAGRRRERPQPKVWIRSADGVDDALGLRRLPQDVSR